MTREKARKAAEVMIAYADGKDIEYRYYLQSVWQSSPIIVFDWNHYDYRVKKEPSNNIKPEPTYRPFKDKEECWNEMQKHQPFGWVKNKKEGYLSTLTIVSDDNRFDCLNESYTFADGTPFGIKEE